MPVSACATSSTIWRYWLPRMPAPATPATSSSHADPAGPGLTAKIQGQRAHAAQTPTAIANGASTPAAMSGSSVGCRFSIFHLPASSAAARRQIRRKHQDVIAFRLAVDQALFARKHARQFVRPVRADLDRAHALPLSVLQQRQAQEAGLRHHKPARPRAQPGAPAVEARHQMRLQRAIAARRSGPSLRSAHRSAPRPRRRRGAAGADSPGSTGATSPPRHCHARARSDGGRTPIAPLRSSAVRSTERARNGQNGSTTRASRPRPPARRQALCPRAPRAPAATAAHPAAPARAR